MALPAIANTVITRKLTAGACQGRAVAHRGRAVAHQGQEQGHLAGRGSAITAKVINIVT